MPLLDADQPLYSIKKALDPLIQVYDKEKLAGFTLLSSHKFKNPRLRAHVAYVGQSSSGKSHTLETVLKLFDLATPREYKQALQGIEPEQFREQQKQYLESKQGLLLTGVSKEVLKYLEFSLDHKIIAITELDAALSSMAFLRQAMSEGDSLSIVTGSTKSGSHYAQFLASTGKAVWAATTASEELEHQFGNRTSLLHLDPTPGDQAKIHQSIAIQYGDPVEYERRLEDLEPLKKELRNRPMWDDVRIPYASKVAEVWQKGQPAQNRLLADFLRLNGCVAAFHGRTNANADDYEMARFLYCAQKHKLPGVMLTNLKDLQSELNLKAIEQGLDPTASYIEGRDIKVGVTHDELSMMWNVSGDTTQERVTELLQRRIMYQQHRSMNYTVNGQNYTKKIQSLFTITDYGRNNFYLRPYKEMMGTEYHYNDFCKPYNPLTGEHLTIPKE